MAFGGEMEAAGSPARADALVWAITDLLIDSPLRILVISTLPKNKRVKALEDAAGKEDALSRTEKAVLI